MTEISNKDLITLHSLLERAEAELQQQLDLSKAATDVVTLDQSMVGRVSRVDAMQQQSMAVSTREMATKRLRKVKLALKNMDNEDYGFCQQCDEPIAVKRLMAQPEARFCLNCQDASDRQQ